MCKYIGNDRSVVRHERRIGWWPHRLGHGYWIPFVAVPRGKGGRLAAIPLVEEGLQAARDFMARVASLLSAYGALRHALHPGRSPPWSTVDGWRVWSLGPYGSASRNFSIREFLRAHFSKSPNLEEFRCDVHPGEMIDHAANDRDVREHFEELVPGVPIGPIKIL